jgi:hypothetical protein
MTRVADIIREGFRESQLLNEFQSATPTQTSLALARLQNVVSSAYGFEVGEPLSDWPVGTEGIHQPQGVLWQQLVWERPHINARLIAASADAQTIYLPARPYDGSRIALIDPASRLAAAPITLDAQGRTIEGAATYVGNTNGLTKIWFYRADLGNWAALTPLTLIGDFPFPPEWDDYFTTMLAMRVNPRYGRSMTQESLAALGRSLSMLQARYKQSQSVGVSAALLNLSPHYNSGDNRVRPYAEGAEQIGDRGWGWMT